MHVHVTIYLLLYSPCILDNCVIICSVHVHLQRIFGYVYSSIAQDGQYCFLLNLFEADADKVTFKV